MSKDIKDITLTSDFKTAFIFTDSIDLKEKKNPIDKLLICPTNALV